MDKKAKAEAKRVRREQRKLGIEPSRPSDFPPEEMNDAIDGANEEGATAASDQTEKTDSTD